MTLDYQHKYRTRGAESLAIDPATPVAIGANATRTKTIAHRPDLIQSASNNSNEKP